MREYLLCIVGIVLFSAVLIGVLPNGKTSEIIKNIARIACLVTILSPIVRFFVDNQNIKTFFEKSGIQTQVAFIEYCREEQVSEVERLLRNELKSKWDFINDVEIIYSIRSDFNGSYHQEGICIEKIRIFVNQVPFSIEEEEIVKFLSNKYAYLGGVDIVQAIDKE